MELRCPRCRSKTNELMECEDCLTIGCHRCIKKKRGKWVCYKCESPKKFYEYDRSRSESEEESSIGNALSSMFG